MSIKIFRILISIIIYIGLCSIVFLVFAFVGVFIYDHMASDRGGPFELYAILGYGLLSGVIGTTVLAYPLYKLTRRIYKII